MLVKLVFYFIIVNFFKIILVNIEKRIFIVSAEKISLFDVEGEYEYIKN